MKLAPLSNDVRLILAFTSLRTVSDLFFGMFFVSFIMQNSISEILLVSKYELFVHAALGAGFFMVANWVKKYNKVAAFRMHLLPKAACLVLVALMGSQAVSYTIPLGILVGFSAALYWSPMHLMVGEKVRADQMARFTGYRTMVGGITRIISPVILGLFITVGSFQEMATALLIICGIEFVLTLFMKSSMHRSKNNVDYAGFARCVMRFPIIRNLFTMEILRGISISGPMGTIITMYAVYMFKTDLNLGIFTTIFAFVLIARSFLFGRFARKPAFKGLLYIAAISSVAGLSLFVAHTTVLTFLIYNFIWIVAIGTLSEIIETNMYNLSKSRCVTKDHKTEYFLFRESALTIGRVVGYGGLGVIGLLGGYEWLQYYMIALIAVIVLIGYYAIRINPHIKG